VEEILYTVSETADLLKCNVSYIHKLRKAGLLPFLKLGSYKCRRTALLKFLRDFEGMDLTDPFNVQPIEGVTSESA